MKSKNTFLGLLALLICSFTFAQSIDDIVNKHIEALGGADNIKKVSSIKMLGNINAGGTQIPVTVYLVNGKSFRVEFTASGMTGYQIITNSKGWNFMPFGGQKQPEPMTDDDVKKNQDNLDVFDELVFYKEKGNAVESLGKEDIEGTECFKLKVTLKSGKEKTFYLATDNYLILKKVEKATVNGAEMEVSEVLSNYKKIGDVNLPYTIANSMQGQVDFSSIEVNPKIDPSVFEVAPTNK